jgi:hypothetical protein
VQDEKQQRHKARDVTRSWQPPTLAVRSPKQLGLRKHRKKKKKKKKKKKGSERQRQKHGIRDATRTVKRMVLATAEKGEKSQLVACGRESASVASKGVPKQQRISTQSKRTSGFANHNLKAQHGGPWTAKKT